MWNAPARASRCGTASLSTTRGGTTNGRASSDRNGGLQRHRSGDRPDARRGGVLDHDDGSQTGEARRRHGGGGRGRGRRAGGGGGGRPGGGGSKRGGGRTRTPTSGGRGLGKTPGGDGAG